MRLFLKKWWPTCIVVAVILYATLNSDPVGADQLPLIPHIDKLIHAVMFGGLFSAICFDYYRAGNALTQIIMLVVAAISICAGGLNELAQGVVDNGRTTEGLDFVADCVGVAVAYITAPPAIRRVVKKH